MSVLTALYTLLIRPLELGFEVVYVVVNRVINNPGLSIIALSLAMNFLVLPLYRRADAMQEEERALEAGMEKWVTHIRRTFTGDKRFMILQEYYRQNHYKPTYALRGSFSLLLEIPFFIAAYRFLSGLELLHGVSFGPIIDLGAPHALICIGELRVNLLPILMTLINVVSGAVYTKGMPLKSKVQLYAMALVFLVFLYSSPSGLVFYWTLNNIFSLVKNLFYKLRNPRAVLYVLASAFGLGLIAVFGFLYPVKLKPKLFFVALGGMLQLPLLLRLIPFHFSFAGRRIDPGSDNRLFIISALIDTVLVGVMIPSAVISSSPAEFINDVSHFSSPLSYTLYSGLIALGTFMLWAGLFYYLMTPQSRSIFSKIYFSLSCVFLFDYLVYGKGQSNLSATLQYEKQPWFPRDLQLLNLFVVFVLVAVIYYCAVRLPNLTRVLSVSALLAVCGMSVLNIRNTTVTLRSSLSYIKEQSDTAAKVQENGLIHLSRNGKNVVFLMLDRAMGSYTPFIMDEKPELIEKFDGFTAYHNTISYGRITIYGAPAMMAGYEYTPAAINARSEDTFLQKHNESSLVMPVLFDSNGFQVTLCDPPLAGLEYVPNLTIYDDYPNIKTYMINKRLQLVDNDISDFTEPIRKRNFFFFGLTKVAPLLFQSSLYNAGLYNEAIPSDSPERMTEQIRSGLSTAKGLSKMFMNTYSVMHELKSLTRIDDTSENHFFFMCNEMTHEVNMLQEPDYVPSLVVDNTPFDDDLSTRYNINGRHMRMTTPGQVAHYDSNMSAMIQLAAWFDFLREEGVYDNTRIILVSDHGTSAGQFDALEIDDVFDAQEVAALLMVKDFDATGFSFSEEFMTNADAPLIAMKDLIENPVNPFTGKELNDEEKYAHDQEVLHCKIAMPEFRDGFTYPDGDWYSVHGNIYEKSNWTHIEK